MERRILALALVVGSAIGIAVVAVADVDLARKTRRAAAAAAAAAPHGPEERQLAIEISRYLAVRGSLDRRAGILARLKDSAPPPTLALRRVLAWAAERQVAVARLKVADGELRALLVTGDPEIAITLARHLVSSRLIDSPEVRWTVPSGGGNGSRRLEVSGRLTLGAHGPALPEKTQAERR